VIKSTSTFPNLFLEETNTFDNSIPESETFRFNLEENSSGSPTTRPDLSLPDYKAFYVDNDHFKERSSGSTTTHVDFSQYDSFIFDLSNDQFPPTDRSDLNHEEFADELAHIISPPEYDHFCFKIEPELGNLTMDVVNDIFPTREPRVHVPNVLPTQSPPFGKFSEPFLYLVGLSHYYDLDDNVYPTFLTDTKEEMDLFAFIRHADPIKVWIGESQAGSIVRVDYGGQNDNIEILNEGSGYADQENHSEDSDRTGQDEAVTIVVDEEFLTVAADKPKSKKEEKKSCGKSLAALQGLLDHSTLAVEVGVMAAATVSFVTSSVTPTPEREGDGNTNFVSRTNLHTQRPSKRFVISSDSSHHSSTNVADAEVPSSAPVLGADAELVSQVHLSIFADSASIGATWLDVASPSDPTDTEQSTDTFYISQEMDFDTLRQIYVLKWNVVNESDVCRGMIDQLFPRPASFFPTSYMDYDPALCQFNVERHVSIMSYTLKRDRDVCKIATHRERTSRVVGTYGRRDEALSPTKLLKEKSVLEGKVTTLESSATAKETELASLTTQTTKLTQDFSSLELSCDELSVNVASFESQRDGFADQVSLLETTWLDSKLMALSLHLDKEFYPRFLTTIAGRRWIIGHDLRLAVMKCHQSPEYGAAFGAIIGFTIDKGIQLCCTEDNVVTGETSLSDSLGVVHACVQKLKEGALSHHLSSSDAMGVLANLLSSKNLTGEASTLGVPVTVSATTALAISVIAANIISIPPVSVAD
ncbi:hypothetical protein Tco_0845661, partial [Tanacetum coccineum]